MCEVCDAQGKYVDDGNGSLIGEVNAAGSFVFDTALADGPYHKPIISSNDGTVYAIAGASGKLSRWTDNSTVLVNPNPHPVHIVNLRLLGSLYIEVDELNMNVVAEGVETEADFNFIKSLGCDIAQGYFFSKPVASDELEAKYFAIQG